MTRPAIQDVPAARREVEFRLWRWLNHYRPGQRRDKALFDCGELGFAAARFDGLQWQITWYDRAVTLEQVDAEATPWT